MNQRVAKFRASQREKGLTEISIWLDSASVTLLKQARESQNKQAGEIIGEALQACYSSATGSSQSCFSNATEQLLIQKITSAIHDVFAGSECISSATEQGEEASSAALIADQEPAPTFGAQLATAMAGANLTMRELVSKSGLSRTTLSCLLKDERAPTQEVLNKLALVFPLLAASAE